MERTARIPVFESTKRKLVLEKKRLRAKLGRKLTWDEFLLEHRGC
jgi:hypothetical protein